MIMPGADQNIKTEVYQIKPTDLEMQPIVFLSEMKCNTIPHPTFWLADIKINAEAVSLCPEF